ncbi:MAG: hypothetical protein ACR2IE_05820 [Candidatus Sumerlaeaceae bacterium]
MASLDEAVNAVAYFQRQVDAHIAGGALTKVHGSAFSARDAASSATQYTDGLPESARSELTSAIQRIGAIAVQLDKYGDAGKTDETTAFARKLQDEVNGLQRITGITVLTDWKPTFLEAAAVPASHGHAASKCPHKANHGGRFSMALNDVYHVEGSYPASGEFRMHFYDKDSCPIPAQGFSGRLLLQDGQEQIELVQASDGTHLVGRLATGLAPPVSVTAILRLPDSKTGAVATEHFSYNFYKLSKPPSDTHGSNSNLTTTTQERPSIGR